MTAEPLSPDALLLAWAAVAQPAPAPTAVAADRADGFDSGLPASDGRAVRIRIAPLSV